MDERRKTPRFKKKLLITTIYQNDAGEILTDDSIFSADISTSGLKISCPALLPKGRILDLKVFLFSDPICLPARGKVVWSNEKRRLEVTTGHRETKLEGGLYWAGIQFVDIDLMTRMRIMTLLKKEFM